MKKRKNEEVDEMEEEVKKIKDDDDISVIIKDKLYLGNERGSQNFELLKSHGITAILNCSSDSPEYFNDKFSYLKLNLEDIFEEDLSKHFEKAHQFLENNDRIFIFCQSGISRSASILLSFMMKKLQLTLKFSFEKMKEIRQGVLPNVSFMWQLIKYEKEILGSESMSFIEYVTFFFYPLFEDLMEFNELKIKIEEIAKRTNNFDDLIQEIYEL